MTAPKAPAVEALLPCPNPWCEAAEREGDFRPQIHYSNFAMVYVACTSCTMAGPTRQHEAEAIAAWNQRAPADALAALSAKPEAGESARISFLEKELEGRDVRLAYLNTEVERLRERLTAIANHSKTPGMEDVVIDILQRMASAALKGTPSDGK